MCANLFTEMSGTLSIQGSLGACHAGCTVCMGSSQTARRQLRISLGTSEGSGTAQKNIWCPYAQIVASHHITTDHQPAGDHSGSKLDEG